MKDTTRPGKSAAQPIENTLKPIENTLWKAADSLRKNIDAAEYKPIVLGLIFLKYISDAFEALHKKARALHAEAIQAKSVRLSRSGCASPV